MPDTNLSLAPATIRLGGRNLSQPETAALAEIRIQQKLSLPALCELTFLDQFGSRSLISPEVAGLNLEVFVPGETAALFSGDITVLEYGYGSDQGQTLRVRAYAALHRLRKRHSVRTFAQCGLLDLARELTGPIGLAVEGVTAPVTWRRIIQAGQTDFNLLHERAQACGLHFVQRGNTLHFLTLEGLGESVPLVLGESLLEAHFELNGEPACRSVTTQGWNPLLGLAHQGKAQLARSGRAVAAEVPPERLHGKGEHFLLGRALGNDRAAEALAQGRLDTQAAREVTLWGVAQGKSALQPGSRVAVRGVAAALAGHFVLTEVSHSFTPERGFTSEFSTCPPALPEAEGGLKALLGRVSSVVDPEGLGRVQAVLPACSDLETDWMQVLAPAAGAGKGLMMLPNVGDLVAVLCPEGDFAQGFVLGGFFGPEGPSDPGVENGRSQRFTLRTAGGQAIQFDDASKQLTLTDGTGSALELRPGRLKLRAAGDLEIEAPGRTILIRGKAINFEEG